VCGDVQTSQPTALPWLSSARAEGELRGRHPGSTRDLRVARGGYRCRLPAKSVLFESDKPGFALPHFHDGKKARSVYAREEPSDPPSPLRRRPCLCRRLRRRRAWWTPRDVRSTGSRDRHAVRRRARLSCGSHRSAGLRAGTRGSGRGHCGRSSGCAAGRRARTRAGAPGFRCRDRGYSKHADGAAGA
jgi:hypothetical protein